MKDVQIEVNPVISKAVQLMLFDHNFKWVAGQTRVIYEGDEDVILLVVHLVSKTIACPNSSNCPVVSFEELVDLVSEERMEIDGNLVEFLPNNAGIKVGCTTVDADVIESIYLKVFEK